MALELSRGVRHEIGEIQKRLASRLVGWRWVAPDSLHLTLRFLGDVPDEVERAARAQWSRAAAQVERFRFRLGKLESFPRSGRPRVLWLAVAEPTGRLAALQAALENAARAASFPAEPRPFHAHLTLARARSAEVRSRPDPGLVPGEWEEAAERVVLLGSCRERSGARYTALAVFPLKSGHEQVCG